jgi:hypothetical protein
MKPPQSRSIYIAWRRWVVKRFSGKSEPASRIGQTKQGTYTPNLVGE